MKPLALKWTRLEVEYFATSELRPRYAGERTVVGWRAYKSRVGEWSLGISVGQTGTHIVVARAPKLREIKLRAEDAAIYLGHVAPS